MADYCKQCDKENNNGTNFCSKKCRKQWIREHNIKGAKKKAQRLREDFMMHFGSHFSNEE